MSKAENGLMPTYGPSSPLACNVKVLLAGVLEQIASGAQKMDHKTIQQETEWICTDVVQNLLEKTGTHPSEVMAH